MPQPQNKINKDLILREKLAIERTIMANDRTLLSFIRTALYFTVAGLSINDLLKLPNGPAIELLSYIISTILVVVGVIKYLAGLKKIRESRRHIGNYLLEWDDE